MGSELAIPIPYPLNKITSSLYVDQSTLRHYQSLQIPRNATRQPYLLRMNFPESTVKVLTFLREQDACGSREMVLVDHVGARLSDLFGRVEEERAIFVAGQAARGFEFLRGLVGGFYVGPGMIGINGDTVKVWFNQCFECNQPTQKLQQPAQQGEHEMVTQLLRVLQHSTPTHSFSPDFQSFKSANLKFPATFSSASQMLQSYAQQILRQQQAKLGEQDSQAETVWEGPVGGGYRVYQAKDTDGELEVIDQDADISLFW